MELTGKLIKKLPLTQGTSKAGKPWSKVSFVVEYESGKYPKTLCLDSLNDVVIQFMTDTAEGTELHVFWDTTAREYGGKYYNSVNAWKVEINRAVETAPPIYANQNVNISPEEEDGLPF